MRVARSLTGNLESPEFIRGEYVKKVGLWCRIKVKDEKVRWSEMNRKIIGIVMAIMVLMGLNCKCYGKSHFVRLNSDEIQKNTWKLHKNVFGKELKRFKVVDFVGGDTWVLQGDKDKNRTIFYLYGVNTPDLILKEKGWDLSVNYFNKLKLVGKYVDVVIMGSYDWGYDDVQIGLVWFKDININTEIIKNGYGTYSLNIPSKAVVGWEHVSSLDFNYLINCFIEDTEYAYRNKLGVWKLYGFKYVEDKY